MKKLILWLRNYWYIVLVAGLLFNSTFFDLYPSLFKGQHKFYDFSLKGFLFEKVNLRDREPRGINDFFVTPELKLRPYVDSLQIAGHTYTAKDHEFQQFFHKLATNEHFQQQFRNYYLEDLSRKELYEISNYYNKLKPFQSSIIHDSKKEKELIHRLIHVYDKQDIKLRLIPSANDTESSIEISLNKDAFKEYRLNRTYDLMIYVVYICAIIALFVLYYIMLRYISLKRRLWFIELLLCTALIIPEQLINRIHDISSFISNFQYISILALIFIICFNTPTRLSHNKIWYYLFVSYLVLAEIFYAFHIGSTWYYSLAISLFLIIWQFHKIKGLKKRVMWKWLTISLIPSLILIISMVLNIVFIKFVYAVMDRSALNFVSSDFVIGFTYLEFIGGSLFSFALVISLFFPFLALLSALTEFSIRYYNAIRKWIAAFMVFSGYMTVFTFGINSQNRTFKNDLVTIYFIISLGLLFTYLIMKVYRYFDAVRHNERKHLRSLLEGSFGISTIDEYFAYYQEVILKLYPKTQIAFISGDLTINDNDNLKLPSLEVVQAIPDTNYFNLDIAIIDGEPISEVFPVLDAPPRKSKKGSNVSQSHEVHLYFPLYNSEHQHLGYLLFGESGKLYWDKENADFLYETVQLFQSFLSSLMLQTQYRNEQLKLEREKQERIFEHQIATERELRAQELEEANRRMTDSISYAALIQQSILPNESILTNYLDNYFLLWKPHDVVGGDFFWFCPIPNSKSFLLAIVDCTGHGVPGAFMTIMTNSILNSIVRDRNVYDPAEIIKMLHKEVQYTLQQGHKGSMNDGLDISLILLDPTQQKIVFAGAKHRILHWDATMPDNTLAVYRGGRHSVGGIRPELDISLQEINYHSGDMIYLFTDGLIDQPISLDKGIKRMTYDGWREYFYALLKLDIKEQNATLLSKVKEMLMIHEQIDDITVLGIRL